MKKNIGATDRILRALLALLLLALAYAYSSLIALILGLFTLYEACASWCILYQLLGKNSCKISKD
jgi:hypothetical protein